MKHQRQRIRTNQRWKKRDTGRIMTIVCKQNGGWRVVFDNLSRKSSHKIDERVIQKYYDLLE